VLKQTQAHVFADRSAPASDEYRSFVFPVVFSNLTGRQNSSVIDLGTPSGSTFHTYTQRFARIYVEDLLSCINTNNCSFSRSLVESDNDNGQCNNIQFLPYQKGTHFDLICCWDIFNYLKPNELSEVGKHLQTYCHSDTYLVLLISTLMDLFSQPARFSLLDEHTVAFQNISTGTIPSPRYSLADLSLLLPSYSMQNVTLLKNGFYEILMSSNQAINQA
jgi:hypothetical protein